jgi:hypothetical protein
VILESHSENAHCFKSLNLGLDVPQKALMIIALSGTAFKGEAMMQRSGNQVHQNDTRVCTACGNVLPGTREHFRPRSQVAGGGLESTCRTCARERARAYEHAKRIRGIHKNPSPTKTRIRARINEIKLERGCADCGYRAHPAALDFDHLPGSEKRHPVAWLISRNRLEDALAEIEKCEVVCANCHRVRTATRQQYTGRKPKDVQNELLERALLRRGVEWSSVVEVS